MSLIRTHLADNSGDENVAKMVWIAVAFILGAIILMLVVGAFKGPIRKWFEQVVDAWFNADTANGVANTPLTNIIKNTDYDKWKGNYAS